MPRKKSKKQEAAASTETVVVETAQAPPTDPLPADSATADPAPVVTETVVVTEIVSDPEPLPPASMPVANDDDSRIPLVVDVDGTLITSDILAESYRMFLLHKPTQALVALTTLSDRAAFKKKIADSVDLDMQKLPFNPQVMALVAKAKADGRKVYLASASDRKYVEALAEALQLFDGVFASDGALNLKAEAKARVLCEAFGEKGFDYVGDGVGDFAVWQKSREVIVVGTSAYVAREAKLRFPHARILGKPIGIADYARALRVHQWSKNLLIFVPTVMAHLLTWAHLLPAIIAFFSFSFCASSVYLLNDWFDLDDDREHPVKQHRMLASGGLSLLKGTELIIITLLASVGLALTLPEEFLMVLAVYYALTFAYSLWLKHLVLVDVITLASLYGIRLISGASFGVELSEWLVAFSFFLFLSLALLKRYAELAARAAEGRNAPAGRGYEARDTSAIFSMATASAYIAVLVMALYIQNPLVTKLYASPQWLWGCCIILIYWVSHLLLLTARGKMNEDPVIFVMTDSTSLVCGGLMGMVLWASI